MYSFFNYKHFFNPEEFSFTKMHTSVSHFLKSLQNCVILAEIAMLKSNQIAGNAINLKMNIMKVDFKSSLKKPQCWSNRIQDQLVDQTA